MSHDTQRTRYSGSILRIVNYDPAAKAAAASADAKAAAAEADAEAAAAEADAEAAAAPSKNASAVKYAKTTSAACKALKRLQPLNQPQLRLRQAC